MTNKKQSGRVFSKGGEKHMLVKQKLKMPDLEFERLIFLILSQPEIQEGFDYGKPRPGHPEGEVWKHILEIIGRINMLNDSRETTFKLYIIAAVHDSMKYQVKRHKPKIGINNHGMLARKFLERFVIDENLLNIIELHDAYYYQWKKFNDTGFFSEKTFRKMADRLKGDMELFVKFALIDGTTGNKSMEPREWLHKKLLKFGYLPEGSPVKY